MNLEFLKAGLMGTNQEGIPEQKWIYPFEQERDVPPTRWHTLDGVANPYLKAIREKELVNPAPFSHRTMIDLHPNVIKSYQLPIGFEHLNPANTKQVRMDVPIDRILGVSVKGHYQSENSMDSLDNITFRQALFENLHGGGLNQECLDFLAGDGSKDQPMPDDPAPNKKDSMGALEITQYGKWFYVHNGKQRVIFAMFHIWQIGGTHIKNVKVTVQA